MLVHLVWTVCSACNHLYLFSPFVFPMTTFSSYPRLVISYHFVFIMAVVLVQISLISAVKLFLYTFRVLFCNDLDCLLSGILGTLLKCLMLFRWKTVAHTLKALTINLATLETRLFEIQIIRYRLKDVS